MSFLFEKKTVAELLKNAINDKETTYRAELEKLPQTTEECIVICKTNINTLVNKIISRLVEMKTVRDSAEEYYIDRSIKFGGHEHFDVRVNFDKSVDNVSEISRELRIYTKVLTDDLVTFDMTSTCNKHLHINLNLKDPLKFD